MPVAQSGEMSAHPPIIGFIASCTFHKKEGLILPSLRTIGLQVPKARNLSKEPFRAPNNQTGLKSSHHISP